MHYLLLTRKFSQDVKDGIMMPDISTILKIVFAVGNNMSESLRLEAGSACRCGERLFAKILLGGESSMDIRSYNVKEVSRNIAMNFRPNTTSMLTVVKEYRR